MNTDNINHSATKSSCMKSAAFVLFVSLWSISSACATRRYVRRQIAINNCVQVLNAIDRELRILDAAAEMDAERIGPTQSDVGRKAHQHTLYEMLLRLENRRETTEKIIEAKQ